MAAWSHELLGNDTACNWSALSYLDETLQRMPDAGDDEDPDIASG